jgi:hypothetical protein
MYVVLSFPEICNMVCCSLLTWSFFITPEHVVVCRPVRLAYQPPANSIFLSEQTSHQQSASSTFLSEQTSTSHQPNEQAGCTWFITPPSGSY